MKLFDRIIFSKKKLFKACFSIHSCFVSLVQKVSDAGLTSVISISITSKSDKHTWLLYSFKCSFIVNNIIKTYILEKAYYLHCGAWKSEQSKNLFFLSLDKPLEWSKYLSIEAKVSTFRRLIGWMASDRDWATILKSLKLA